MIKNQSQFVVSIYCMTYNHAPYIVDAMNGFCMQQTNFPFVAIIVDDASTDGEPEIINNYVNAHFDIAQSEQWETDDAVFLFAHHKTNDNCYFAVILLKYNFWQAKKAKAPLMSRWSNTKYRATCEGDDYWIAENKLQKQYDFLELNTDYVFCVHDYKVYFESSKTFLEKKEINSFEINLDNFFEGDFTQPLTSLYRNLDWEIPKGYKFYRDRVFYYYVLKKGKGYFSKDVMGVYRKHSNGMLSGRPPIENYNIYMSIALQIYHKENDKRALTLFRRHALGLFSYRWEKREFKELSRDSVKMLKEAPLFTSLGLLISFAFSLIIGKLKYLYYKSK